MVRKKKKTSAPGYGQPVRFYKVVALGFLCITILLLGLIVFMSSKRATITILTRPEPIETTFSVDVGDGVTDTVSAEFVSEVVTLEKSFSPKGVKEELGVATGIVTLINDSTTDQPLVATTRLLTPDGVLFRIRSGVVVPANSSIETEAYADKEGEGGNIEPSDFTIPGLNANRQKQVYAKSKSDMSGGIKYVGIISTKDVQQAEVAFKEELEQKGKDTLQAAHEGKKGVFKLISSDVTSDTDVGTETSEFILSGSARIVGIFYDEAELKEYAQANLEKQLVGSSETVHQSDSTPDAAIESVEVDENEAVLGVSYSGLVSLDPNSRDLQRLMFYGKTEDEVRRYVLSLDHVTGVEVKFRPIWNKSVPHVADHVNIVVRQVE